MKGRKHHLESSMALPFKGAASSMNGYQNHDPPCPDRGLTLSNLTKTNASILER